MYRIRWPTGSSAIGPGHSASRRRLLWPTQLRWRRWRRHSERLPSKNPNASCNCDRLYLPVDSVITHIFDKHLSADARWNFSRINDYLWKRPFSSDEILIWDDLWFWGFTAQDSSKRDGEAERATKWNEAIAWSLQCLPKEKISEIRSLAEKFVRLLNS